MKIINLFIMILLLTSLVNAQISIISFTANPSIIAPGQEASIDIRLENIGDNDIKGIVVKLDLTNVPFAPIDSASEKAINELEEDDQTTVNFKLIALPDASSQIYKIPVEVNYDTITKTSLISLQVSGKTSLDVVLESSELVKINDKGKVIIKFVNNGLSDIKFLNIILNKNSGYEILSANNIYIGEIDVDDFETAEFDLIAKSEDPELLFNVNYKDNNNKDYSQVRLVKLNVYSLEEAKQLGLVKTNIWPVVITIIVIILIIFFIIRRVRRKKIWLQIILFLQ